MSRPARADILARLVEAVNARDGAALLELASPAMTIVTGRSEKTGESELIAWVERGYDHIDRRWVIDEIRAAGEGELLAIARSQYIWRESGELGDETPVGLLFAFDEADRVVRLEVIDDPSELPA